MNAGPSLEPNDSLEAAIVGVSSCVHNAMILLILENPHFSSSSR